jgi:hypothetical protein
MCAYTHTGGLHVQRWNTSQAIEPSYDPQEIESVLFFAEIVAALSVLGFADIVDDDALAERILKESRYGPNEAQAQQCAGSDSQKRSAFARGTAQAL